MYSKLILFRVISFIFISFLITNTSNATDNNQNDACFEFLLACTVAAESSLQQLSECKDLRGCKKDCGIEKGACKVDAREAKQTCLAQCGNFSGRKKRMCKYSCKKAYKLIKKNCKRVKRQCIEICNRDDFAGDCRAARQSRVQNILDKLSACTNYEQCMGNLEKSNDNNIENAQSQPNNTKSD